MRCAFQNYKITPLYDKVHKTDVLLLTIVIASMQINLQCHELMFSKMWYIGSSKTYMRQILLKMLFCIVCDKTSTYRYKTIAWTNSHAKSEG